MKKNRNKDLTGMNSVAAEEWKLDIAERREIRNFPRSALDTQKNVFYFSIGGLVMPLRCDL